MCVLCVFWYGSLLLPLFIPDTAHIAAVGLVVVAARVAVVEEHVPRVRAARAVLRSRPVAVSRKRGKPALLVEIGGV